MPDRFVISVVDDDETSRVGISTLVRSLGFKTREFASGRALLQSPHLPETSCLISDMQMPEMSGLQLMDALRARGHDIPVIFVTAFPSEKTRAEANSRGASFLIKPFDGENLDRCLKSALKCEGGGSL